MVLLYSDSLFTIRVLKNKTIFSVTIKNFDRGLGFTFLGAKDAHMLCWWRQSMSKVTPEGTAAPRLHDESFVNCTTHRSITSASIWFPIPKPNE